MVKIDAVKGGVMLADNGIIKSAMKNRGFKHHRAEDQFSIRGEYARFLQFVYSREYPTPQGKVVDLVYFSADVVSEKLIIGFYRENQNIDNGVYFNTSCSIPLRKFTAASIEKALDKLIAPIKER